MTEKILDYYDLNEFEDGHWSPNFCPSCGEALKEMGSYWKCVNHGPVMLPLSKRDDFGGISSSKELDLEPATLENLFEQLAEINEKLDFITDTVVSMDEFITHLQVDHS